jgi:ERCC4-type nuclease
MSNKQFQIEIVIDEREITLYDKCSEILSKLGTETIRLSKRVLHLGDIAFQLISDNTTDPPQTILLFERKSLTDLLASVKDGRYKEQSHRLINASPLIAHNIVYLIEGIFTTLKNPSDKAKILSCMTSLNFFKGFSILKTASLNETAEYMIAMSQKIVRDLRDGKPLPTIHKHCRTIEGGLGVVDGNSEIVSLTPPPHEVSSVDYCSVVKQVKKENVTKENIGEIILCQIPGISSITAIAIMKQFANFADLCAKLRENPAVLDTIVIETNGGSGSGKTRKISRTSIQKIREFLL